MSSKRETKHTYRAKLGCRATGRVFIVVLLVFILPFLYRVTNQINRLEKNRATNEMDLPQKSQSYLSSLCLQLRFFPNQNTFPGI